MVFVSLGLWTLPNIICFAADAVVLLAPVAEARRLPAVALLTVHVPESVVEVKVEPGTETLNPDGVVHVPLAVVQI